MSGGNIMKCKKTMKKAAIVGIVFAFITMVNKCQGRFEDKLVDLDEEEKNIEDK